MLRYFFIFICLFLFSNCNGGCASKKIIHHSALFEVSKAPLSATLLWSQKLKGLITDLSSTQDGEKILVTTVPDPEEESGPKNATSTLYNQKGEVLWTFLHHGPIRSQAISEDGRLSVFSDYQEILTGVNALGKEVWSTDGVCKPNILNQPQKIICYHDDDAEAHIAFDVMDFSGKKLKSFPIKKDILTLKYSDDEKYLALALTEGHVLLLTIDGKLLWQKKIKGEILDLDLISQEELKVAVLYMNEKGQKVALFGASGALVAEGSPTTHTDQLEMTLHALVLYGNNSKGQHLSYLEIPKHGTSIKEKWHLTGSRYADFTPPLFVGRDRILMGFEDADAPAKHSHVLLFDFEGKLLTDIGLKLDEGAYLYSLGASDTSPFLYIATDDSTLLAFHLSR